MYIGMKVVISMEQQNHEVLNEGTNKQYLKIKKFHFVMLMFFVVFLTAGITIVALAFGDEKAVQVGVVERQEFHKLYDAYDKLKKEYYRPLDEETLINGAIDGMIEALDDPYSNYMNEEEARRFHESITSSFEGIGAEIQEQDGFIMIVSPLKNSPAEKAGLKPNDKILKVDGKSIQGMSVTEAVMLIRGEKGTEVTLTISRPGMEDTMDVTIVRDTIPLETVYAEMMDHGIAKVQITSFSENTYNELLDALDSMEEQGMKGLIIDLRQNPGGLLDQALKVSNLFVKEGEVLLQIEDRNGKRESYYAEGGKKVDVPVAVVIDNGSASASEILAAAVSQSANIPLIGETTFGKGTVQSAADFSDGSNMKITTAKWLTPNGTWIHEKGIQPDYEVQLPPYANLPYIQPDKELKVSTLSKDVKAAEEMLQALGFTPGTVDGYFDEQTEQAVMAFQKENELEPTGVLTGSSTVQLMEQVRQLIIDNDTQIQKAMELLMTNTSTEANE
jgi:carboxyl-terminal processing protease